MLLPYIFGIMSGLLLIGAAFIDESNDDNFERLALRYLVLVLSGMAIGMCLVKLLF